MSKYVRRAKAKTILDELHHYEEVLRDQIDRFNQMAGASDGRRKLVYKTLSHHVGESLTNLRVAINALLSEIHILEDEKETKPGQ